MEYLSESMLCSQYDWDVLSEPVQQDLYRIITEIPETTIDYRDGSFDIVSPLPYELNFSGKYNIVQRNVQPVPMVFRNYSHIDTFYPEVYFKMRKEYFMCKKFTVEQFIDLVTVITMGLTNNTMVYLDVFKENYNFSEILNKI
jgi:hypothetical protein